VLPGRPGRLSGPSVRPVQTASPYLALVIYFAAYTALVTHSAFQRAGQPQKLSLPFGDLDPHLIHGSLGQHESASKRHLDNFSRFCMDRERDQQADRQRAASVTKDCI